MSKVRRNGEKAVLPPFEDKKRRLHVEKIMKANVHHQKIASSTCGVLHCGWCA